MKTYPILIVITGGLHAEKARFICLGWTAALTDSFVVKARTPDSFLKVSNIRRTQHINQVKAVVLSVFQRKAYEDANKNANESLFEEWRQRMINCSATVGFCDFFYKLMSLF